MRILFISAFYPPHVFGGWEQLVRDINVRLQARGHVTHVLTSIHGIDKSANSANPAVDTLEGGVSRVLTLENDLFHYKPMQFFVGRERQIQRNLTVTAETIRRFNPDVIFLHGMWNLSKRIPWLIEQIRPGQLVYYMASDWPHAPDVHAYYWRDAAQKRVRQLPKRVLGTIAMRMLARENRRHPLQFEKLLCVSQAVKDDLARYAAIPLERMTVVYMSVETEKFGPAGWLTRASRAGRPLALLFAGSVVPHKGVHTAVEALAHLTRKPDAPNVTLTIVGSGHPDYEARLRNMVEAESLTAQVSFRSHVPREQMPDLLREFDLLLFPTITAEPLARMTMEGMATGLVVVGTTTGGTKEILFEGETGLTFPPEDAATLAAQIERLCHDPDLCGRLAQNARDLMVRRFDLNRMVDEIEHHLRSVTQKAPTAPMSQQPALLAA